MRTSRLRVVAAGPLVTLQDRGRFGSLRYGIPASGPMDRVRHAVANTVAGNPLDATSVEVSRAGAVFECIDGPVTVAAASPGFRLAVNATPIEASAVVTLAPGDRLSVASGPTGSWAYVAVAGRLDTPSWFGSRATHAPSGLGGQRLAAGDELVILASRAEPVLDGPIPSLGARFDASADLAAQPHLDNDQGRVTHAVRVVLGPQDHRFTTSAVGHFLTERFTLTEASDRMGVRLDGPPLELDQALSIPSEPIVRGSVQVAGDGIATVLLADHQTTGGYPKIATVVGADLDPFAQLRSGDAIRFRPVSAAESIRLVRARAASLQAFLTGALMHDRELARRLADADLIGDVTRD